MAMKSPITDTIKRSEEAFDEKFGKANPDDDLVSIGRQAGCDDCTKNQEIRQEHKAFLKSTQLNLLKVIEEEIDGLKEMDINTGEEKPHYDSEWNEALDEARAKLHSSQEELEDTEWDARKRSGETPFGELTKEQ